METRELEALEFCEEGALEWGLHLELFPMVRENNLNFYMSKETTQKA